MAAKPLTNETIAVTEMKMEMTLDEIIKLSKKDPPNKKNARARRFSNKNRNFLKDSVYQSNSYKAQDFLESRSSIRQGVLAKRRTNFQRNQFQFTTEVARNGSAPSRNRGAGNWNRMRKPTFQVKAAEGDVSASRENKLVPKQRQTLDARFASIAVQRKKTLPLLQRLPLRGGPRDRDEQRQQLPQPKRGRNASFPVGAAGRFTTFRR